MEKKWSIHLVNLDHGPHLFTFFFFKKNIIIGTIWWSRAHFHLTVLYLRIGYTGQRKRNYHLKRFDARSSVEIRVNHTVIRQTKSFFFRGFTQSLEVKPRKQRFRLSYRCDLPEFQLRTKWEMNKWKHLHWFHL